MGELRKHKESERSYAREEGRQKKTHEVSEGEELASEGTGCGCERDE